jgi:hypothetical protein
LDDLKPAKFVAVQSIPDVILGLLDQRSFEWMRLKSNLDLHHDAKSPSRTHPASKENSGDGSRRIGVPVLLIGDAQDGADPVHGGAGDAGQAAPDARRIVHSLECAQPPGMQDELLREQDLLRGLEKK